MLSELILLVSDIEVYIHSNKLSYVKGFYFNFYYLRARLSVPWNLHCTKRETSLIEFTFGLGLAFNVLFMLGIGIVFVFVRGRVSEKILYVGALSFK